MKEFIINLFDREKRPRKHLLALEWVVLAYIFLTLIFILLTYTKLNNPEAMIFGRIKIIVITLALWFVYRMYPSRLTIAFRVGVQLALLSWWYPDTYELNRILPNLDYVFASWEQSIFGCQIALIFSKAFPWPFFSELMDLGYASYYPMIALVVIFYFIFRYKEFERASFIILTGFFIYYVIFILLPVTGPTFYYKAVGISDIAQGIFPNIKDYFNYCQDCLEAPGYSNGIFYQLVEQAKAAGERPTAAFPSSHVGISTIVMMLIWHSKNHRFFYVLLPFYILLCFATVYIQAHYAIDAIAGLISGIIIYFALMGCTKKMKAR